ncbi:MAG: hypothetical protein JW883_03550 [Deltaproteobacteria bacterium]|nr:hypothetical protein [Deltaproteobacteria bacterium]
MASKKSIRSANRVGFAVGTGRCGTTFLSRVIELEPDVAHAHERNRLNESFHRYCKWYGLPVDDEGFLHTKGKEIEADLKEKIFSFEASAHLSLSVEELHSRFAAKFVLLVRSPEKVVNSYLRKGWYREPIFRSNLHQALGYQECDRFQHFLGRIVPSGEAFKIWTEMTRVGKLSWFWNVLNERVLQQFAAIPESQWRVVKLEELSYRTYLDIAAFLGFESRMGAEAYENVARARPNALPGGRSITDWTEAEKREFEMSVAPMAGRLGYEFRVDTLLKEKEKQRPRNQDLEKKEGTIAVTGTAPGPEIITIVIRSCGERTEKACFRSLAQQVPEQNIVVIREYPFAKALAETFKIGLERGRPWTLCVDADVLLRKGAVREFLRAAAQSDEKTFEIQYNVLDKFFGGPKPAGNHLYRTRLLRQALDFIPEDTVTMRPETSVIKAMGELGFPWVQEATAIGLHDYEQYYRDIYRKALVHACKHRKHVSHLRAFWRNQPREDRDFQVALWGLQAGLVHHQRVTLDARMFREDVDILLNLKGWQEKGELLGDRKLDLEVGEFMDAFDPPEAYWAWKRLVSEVGSKGKCEQWGSELSAVLDRTGWLRILPWLAGWGMARVGRAIQRWIEG